MINPKWHNHKWRNLGTITLIYVFLNIAVFNTLGVVLAYMVESLDWSFTAAGFSYTVLGVACGIGSLFPIISLKKIGPRNTVALGCTMLAFGFALCLMGKTITVFYLAMAFIGAGFAMSGNLPAVWIIGARFGDKSPRIIGLYMMAGAVGAIIGPPLVQAIVATYGWQFHWGAMAIIALICVLISLIITDKKNAPKTEKSAYDHKIETQNTAEPAPSPHKAAPSPKNWPYMDALKTPAFAIIALAVTLLLTAVTTISAIGVSHLTKLGATAQSAALSLGFFALIGTLSKGLAGPICERFSSHKVLFIGALLQGLGLIILAGADNFALLFLWSFVFGAGWGATYVACTVILLEYFGHETGARAFAACHILASVAAFGPLAAGGLADLYGSFSSVFYICGALLFLSAIPVLRLKAPTRSAAAPFSKILQTT